MAKKTIKKAAVKKAVKLVVKKATAKKAVPAKKAAAKKTVAKKAAPAKKSVAKKAASVKAAAAKAASSAKRFCSSRKPAPKVLPKGINKDRAQLIMQNADKWANGTTLTYFFFDKDTDGANVKDANGKNVWKTWKGTKKQMDAVRNGFKAWKALGIGLDFKEVTKREEANIRIAFMEDDGSWSYLGRDVLTKRKDPRTMNFGWDISVADKHNGMGTVLHEIGHTLGFPHEHQNPFAGIVWNKPAVYKSLGGDPNFWSKEETDSNIIDKLSTKEVNGSTWDPDSIMHYPFEKGLILEPKQYANKDLTPPGTISKQDVEYALKFYPKQNAQADTVVADKSTFTVNVGNTEQQNFVLTPKESKTYTFQTTGQLDTVMVVSEKLANGTLKFVAGDDNSGTDDNAMVSVKLTKGKTYVINIKVYYKKAGSKAAFSIS